MRPSWPISTLAAAVLISGCGAGNGRSGHHPEPAAPATATAGIVAPGERGIPVPPSRTIHYEEIQASPSASNAYQLVSILRPDWLRARGGTINNPEILPVVYVDNMRYGPLGALEEIRVGVVSEVRYYSPSAATTRWGSGVMGGAIEVIRFHHASGGIPITAGETGLEGAFALSDCTSAYQRRFPERMRTDPPVLFTELTDQVPERIDGPALAYPEAELFKGRMSGWANVAFVVEPNGSVVDGTLISASEDGFAVEASVWLVESTWRPGLMAGVAVPALMCQRVNFRIGQ